MHRKARKPHALPGNKNGVKLKDLDVRREAFEQYCAHLASGYPREAFFFIHPTHSVCYKTMERYISESPSEFPALLIERAKAARLKYWFDEGKTIMKGGYKGGSPIIWQTVMRNMFRDIHWDVQEKNAETIDTSKLEIISNFFASTAKSLGRRPFSQMDESDHLERSKAEMQPREGGQYVDEK